MKLRELFNALRRPLVGPYQPLRRPAYPVNERLIARQIAAAAARPPNSIRPVVSMPIDFDNLPV
jgi:hypothetical protein